MKPVLKQPVPCIYSGYCASEGIKCEQCAHKKKDYFLPKQEGKRW